MKDRRFRQVLLLIACTICVMLIFHMLSDLPKVRGKQGGVTCFFRSLFVRSEKMVALNVMAGKRLVNECLVKDCMEEAFLHVAAPAISYMAEREPWSFAGTMAERSFENRMKAGKTKEEGDLMEEGNLMEEGDLMGEGDLMEEGKSEESNLKDGRQMKEEGDIKDTGDAKEDNHAEDAASGTEDVRSETGDGIVARSCLTENMKKQILDMETMNTFDTLMKNFYVIDSTTMADGSLLSAERFLAEDLRIDQTSDGPQILIYHTHSQEGYADKENPEATVVGVGRELERILEEYGYRVLHHEGVYDLPSRNGAYSRALPEVEQILSENPSIQVVIDLHRDEMPEKVKLVTEVDGKKMARFMFFNGISRTRKTGVLDYLENPWLHENLAFSFQMEKAAQEYYPGLTRKIYLKGYRYNMHVCPKTLLIELGAQNNTYEEALAACGPLASLLDHVLSGGD